MTAAVRKRIFAINAALFAALFGLVSFNKEVVRPASKTNPNWDVLTGSFPNFIAAYLISLAVVTPVLLRKWRHGRLIVYSWSAIIFLVLVVEEFRPMWGASTYFDIFDVIGSATGAILALLTYEALRFGRLRQKKGTA
jgi:glycopeptide antibiotics resistance protein